MYLNHSLNKHYTGGTLTMRFRFWAAHLFPPIMFDRALSSIESSMQPTSRRRGRRRESAIALLVLLCLVSLAFNLFLVLGAQGARTPPSTEAASNTLLPATRKAMHALGSIAVQLSLRVCHTLLLIAPGASVTAVWVSRRLGHSILASQLALLCSAAALALAAAAGVDGAACWMLRYVFVGGAALTGSVCGGRYLHFWSCLARCGVELGLARWWHGRASSPPEQQRQQQRARHEAVARLAASCVDLGGLFLLAAEACTEWPELRQGASFPAASAAAEEERLRRAASALCGLPADALLRSVAAREQTLWGRVYEVELQPGYELTRPTQPTQPTQVEARAEQASFSSASFRSSQLLLKLRPAEAAAAWLDAPHLHLATRLLCPAVRRAPLLELLAASTRELRLDAHASPFSELLGCGAPPHQAREQLLALPTATSSISWEASLQALVQAPLPPLLPPTEAQAPLTEVLVFKSPRKGGARSVASPRSSRRSERKARHAARTAADKENAPGATAVVFCQGAATVTPGGAPAPLPSTLPFARLLCRVE